MGGARASIGAGRPPQRTAPLRGNGEAGTNGQHLAKHLCRASAAADRAPTRPLAGDDKRGQVVTASAAAVLVAAEFEAVDPEAWARGACSF